MHRGAGPSSPVKGQLFASTWDRRTNANMDNLFVWIYGDQPVKAGEVAWHPLRGTLSGRPG